MNGKASSDSHLVEYSDSVPSNENSLQLFQGHWSSLLPGQGGPGTVPLFQDSRIVWMLDNLGKIKNWKTLDLGPLEAGHTYMLEKTGAEVYAIEGNKEAFLRCLIVKNFFNLKAKFLLGDFAKGLGPLERYDLIVAAGVCYHMEDPIGLIKELSKKTDKIYFWTHYYESNLSLWHPDLKELLLTKWRPDLTTIESLELRKVPQSYGQSLGWAGFCGGPELGSQWVFKEDIISLLKLLGFNDILINDDNPAHQNGPSFSILAQRTQIKNRSGGWKNLKLYFQKFLRKHSI